MSPAARAAKSPAADWARPITRPSRYSGDVKEIVNPLGRHADAGRKGGLGRRGGGGETAAGRFTPAGPEGPDDPGLVLDLRHASTQPRRRADRLRGCLLVQLQLLLDISLTHLIAL